MLSSAQSIDVRIDNMDDDAEERLSDGVMYLDSTDLELGNDPDTLGDQVVGMRFNGIAIPPGATITAAYVEFETDEVSQDATSLTIHGEAADHAAAFTTSLHNLTGRPRTAADVAWLNVPLWSQRDERHQTPDLSSIVQEIVNRGGWQSGNSLVFIIQGTGTRTAEAYDGEPTAAPLLHVEFSAGAPPTPTPTATPTSTPTASTAHSIDKRIDNADDDAEERLSDGVMYLDSTDLELGNDPDTLGDQVVGMRFNGIAIPPGATITAAYVEFETDEVSQDATSLTIHGEAADHAAAFTTSLHNLTGRPRTAADVAWLNVPLWSQRDERHQTPDLSSIVQEIVNRGGWQSGNSLVFIIQGTGTRTAEAYDGEPSAAPLLHVEFSVAAPPTATPTPTTPPTATALPTATPTDVPVPSFQIDVQIDDGEDDAEEVKSSGSVSSTSSDLELTHDPSHGEDQLVGLRFKSIAIPRGATILDAYIELEADEVSEEPTSLTLTGEAADHAEPFNTGAHNLSSRSQTAASVAWANVPPWSQVGEQHHTPDLSKIVQEIVDRSGWASGNSMVFFVDGTGRRVAKSYDGDPPGAALLHVEFMLPTGSDLIADKLEVTQGIQDLNNSVRLVEGKRTFVRFHVRTDSGFMQAPAQLQVQRGGQSVTLLPVNSDANDPIWLHSAPNRGARDDAFLFELPSEFKTGTVTLTARLNPGGDVHERDATNNTATTTVSFEPVPPMPLVLYSVGYRWEDGQNYYPSKFHLDRIESWLERAYPVSEVKTWRRTHYVGSDFPKCGELREFLKTKRTWDLNSSTGIPTTAQYYAVIDDGGKFMRGCGWGYISTGPTGSNTFGWDFDGSYGDWYAGHEIGHAYYRQHAPCGAGGPDADFPHAGARISTAQSGDAALYGFDITTQAIYGPEWVDMMSYCNNQWISDYTYEGILDEMQNPRIASVVGAMLQEQAQTPHMLVSGFILLDTGEITLNPLFIIPDSGTVVERVPGDYAIVLRDASDTELARYPFTPTHYSLDGLDAPSTVTEFSTAGEAHAAEEEALDIHELVPFVEGTVAVEIVGPADSLIQRVSVNPGKPQVTITSPAAGETFSGDSIEVTWTATEPDGEPLIFNVQVSADGGQSWELVAQNVTEQHTTIERINLRAGEDVRIRVWASDGINTSSDEMTAGFTIPNRPPTAEIQTPDQDISTTVGQSVALVGRGYDIDSGSLAGQQLRWISSIDGSLGTGDTLSLVDLSPGVHTIELQADDDAGATGVDAVQVTVAELPQKIDSSMQFLPLIHK